MPSEANRLKSIRQNLEKRRDLQQCIRAFFFGHGYLELDTPVRVAAPANEDYIDALPAPPHFLRTSPELHMKRALAAGYDRIFQLGPCFRSGEIGNRHLEEFTLLEWYQTQNDYLAILEETVQLIRTCARNLNASTTSVFQDTTIDWMADWEILTVHEAFQKYAGESIEKALETGNYETILVESIEPNLGQGRPTVLLDYPKKLAALARIKPDAPHLAERWELYAAGIELANCYTELTDAEEQRRRFANSANLRTSQNRPAYPIDSLYMQALEENRFPECAGIALGFDRLLMLLIDEPDIHNVVAFANEQPL